jgi:hypothetical protein
LAEILHLQKKTPATYATTGGYYACQLGIGKGVGDTSLLACTVCGEPGRFLPAYAGSSLFQKRGLPLGKRGRVITAREQVAVRVQRDADRTVAQALADDLGGQF